MSAPFIPLTPASKPGAPAAGAPFLRFAVLPPTPTTTTASPAITPAPCAQHAAAAPVVNLRRDGERVTHIQIQCPCGQLIELECAY